MACSVNDPDLRQISDFIFMPDDLFSADFAIVFGMSAWRSPLQRSVELYRAGLAGKLLFTGGFNPRIGCPEAIAMAEAAAALGVPSADILVEPDATNTTENVTNSYNCVASAIGIENVGSILLVAIHFHMRRAKMTAARTFPKRIRIGCASYPSAYYSCANWHLSERGRSDVLSEASKIEKYLDHRVPGFSKAVAEV
jgi:uncharacterized SAM-binding protein YcdF (DUF218 family)